MLRGMKLFYSGTSPFVRKVRVLLREAGGTALVEEVAVAFEGQDDLAFQDYSRFATAGFMHRGVALTAGAAARSKHV